VPAAAIAEFPVAENTWRLDPGFLNSLNYEIRTPLSGILGMADLLQDTGLTDAQREYVNATRFCAESLNDVLSAAAEYAADNSAPAVLEEREFEPAALLESTVDEHRLRASLRRVELSCHVDEDVPVALSGDAKRFRHAVSHLLSHAVRCATERRVLVNMTAGMPAAGALSLRVVICDSGWQAGQTRERARTRAEQGAAFPVAVAQRIVTVMGGELTVETAPGGNTRTTLEAPFALSGQDDPEGCARKNASPRILLVEDNDVFQTVVRHMLRRHDLQVDCVSDGPTALEQARSHRYDLVLMDLQMPVMDGFTTTQKMREISGYEETPILAITANTSDEFRDRSARHTMQEFLSKPIRSAELVAAIRRWVR
jgi:two-component system sensor histidine kinase/response regulator